jgi:hypothetical protein
MVRLSRSVPVEIRLWSRVVKTESCWLWQGRATQFGHGRLRYLGRAWMAHRLVWHLTYGPIPDGMLVCHHCDNPRCVNPDHLFLGTYSDNTQDMLRKGRGNPPIGERAPAAKLTREQVRAIRDEYAAGGVFYHQLGTKYGVSEAMVHAIVARKQWKWLE